MDKAKKTIIRLMSVLVLCSINFLNLLFLHGSNLFQNILNLINLNSDKLLEEEKNLYNYQYYYNFNVIYRFIYSIAIFALFMAIIGIIFRLNGTGQIAIVASITTILTSVVIIVSRALESNRYVHKFFTKIALGINNDDFVTMQVLPKYPIAPIIAIIFSLLCILMVKSSNILKIRMYNKSTGLSGATLFLVGMYGYIVIDVLRIRITYLIINNKDLGCVNALAYLREYCIENNFLLNLPISYIIIVIIGLGLLFDKLLKKKWAGILSVLIPVLISIVFIVISFVNKPVIFGNITMDLNICDMVDIAYYAFLVNFLITPLCLNLMLLYIISIKGNSKQIFILITLNMILNVITQIIAKFIPGIAIHYIMWSASDFITAIIVLILIIRIHRFRKLNKRKIKS